jgi:hypothetical protein
MGTLLGTLLLAATGCAGTAPSAIPACDYEWWPPAAEDEYADAVGLTEPRIVPCPPWHLLCRAGLVEPRMEGGGVATRRLALAEQVEGLSSFCSQVNRSLNLKIDE